MKPTRNLWPLAIIITFVLFISGTIGLIVMACSQKVDLVSADYYEQELKFQAQIDRRGHANRLSAQPKIAFDAARQCITISLPPEQAGHEVTGRIHLYRPSAAGLDQQIDLHPDPGGLQTMDASGLRPGLWKVRVSWTVDKQDYFIDQKVVISSKAS